MTPATETRPPALQRFGPAVIVHGPPLLELLRLALLGAQGRRQRDGIETPESTRLLLQTLADAASGAGMSPMRHGDVATEAIPPELVVDELTTEEAAEMLGLGRRQVQRLASTLGGRKRGGVLLLERDAVLALAAERKAHDD